MYGAGDTVRPIMDLSGPSAAASEERLRVLIEVAPEGIFVTRDGAIIYVNRAGAKILGAEDVEEVLRQPLGRYLAPDDLAAGTIRLASVESDRLLPRRVYSVRSSQGTTAAVEATSVAIEWDGAPAALTFAHDITERVRMEAQLSRADRLTALGVLAAGVAHEVNNPLTYVSLGFESLERCVRSMPEAARSEALALLGEMRGGIERVAALMRDLRTFARDREEGPTASADLAEVLASVERLVAHQLKGRATLVLDVPAGLPPVRGATLRLEQVFVNLLLNAVQSFECDKASAVIRVRARLEDEGRVIVEVTDNGPGIPVEILSRIFDPFFTTKEPGKGSGLGLAISQAIVVGAGGDMSVETEQGRGTTFRVTLPVSR